MTPDVMRTSQMLLSFLLPPRHGEVGRVLGRPGLYASSTAPHLPPSAGGERSNIENEEKEIHKDRPFGPPLPLPRPGRGVARGAPPPLPSEPPPFRGRHG